MKQEKKIVKTTAKVKTPARKSTAKINAQTAKTVRKKINRAVVVLANVNAKPKTSSSKKSADGKTHATRALQAAAPQSKREITKNQKAENRKIVNNKTASANSGGKVKPAARQSAAALASPRKVKSAATAKAVKLPAPVKTVKTKIVKSNKPEIKKSFQKIDNRTPVKKAKRATAKSVPVISALKRPAKIEKVKIEKAKNQKPKIEKRQISAAPPVKVVRQKNQKIAQTKSVAAEKNKLVNNKKSLVDAKVKFKTEKAKILTPVGKAKSAKIKIAKSDLMKAARKNSVKNNPVIVAVKKVKSQNMPVKTMRQKNLEIVKTKNQKSTPVTAIKRIEAVANKIEVTLPPIVAVKPKKKKAKAISAAVFRGRKARYDFQVFPLDAEFDAAISAIYVISKRKTDRNKRAHHALVCIGQTESLSGEIKRHAKKCIKKHAANVISILPETNEKRRLKIEEDLKAAHSIACAAAS
ncbi:MAG: hypothetical protein H0U87_08140 [Acidobacteria bacterium]|nr:hypothetical protein [Acidobacteriota bacterium]